MQMFRERVDANAEEQAEITAAVTVFLAEVDRLTADLLAKYPVAA